jgi:multiple sugar transport system ATP-binding protein
MATLLLKSINKIYPNNVQAVFDFNLEIKDKEFIVFVGPSGCGKSTTLRMIAGLEDITAGQLYIDGLMVNNVEPKNRNIAMVFQSYALYPHMTVFNNMSFSLKLRKVKFPIYEENAEAEELKQKNLELFKEIDKVNRQIKKKNEPKELLEKRDELLKQIYANEEKRKGMLVQVKGINELEIKEAEVLIKKIEKEIVQSKKSLEKVGKNIEKLNETLDDQKTSDEDKVEIKKNLKMLEDYKKLTLEGIDQKENQIKIAVENLEDYKKNETPLTSLRKHTSYEIKLEVYKTAQILDLSRYLFRKPAALSGGQRQRVALGRAIVRHPKVFLMDEPLSNLDAKLRVQTRNEISHIHESVGATTIYVTHDQTEAMTMADRIVVMKEGYIQQIGTPKEVYYNPNNIFVAGFIGSPAMNFFNGVFKKDKFIFDGESEFIKLNKQQQALLKDYEGKELVLGVRPESIFFKSDLSNVKATNTIISTCDFAELLGHELVVYSNIQGQKFIIKTSIENDIKNHDSIEFYFNEDALYFFDKETTGRIR